MKNYAECRTMGSVRFIESANEILHCTGDCPFNRRGVKRWVAVEQGEVRACGQHSEPKKVSAEEFTERVINGI